MKKSLRCGFAAILDPARSIHTETVLRALQIYKDLFVGDEIEFILCEDYGSLEGGAHAADYLVSQGVDVVVGHYASSSAIGAAGFYAEHGIAVLLPSATETNLTLDRDSVFRVCANNRDIVETMLGLFAPGDEFNIEVYTDESSYAQNLAGLLKSTLACRPRDSGVAEKDSSIVFIGTGARSEMFLQACESKEVHRDFILTDDAACAHLGIPASINAGRIRGVGFAPAGLINPEAPCVREYVRRYGEMPGVFFLETIAALEIVSELQATSDDFIADLNRGAFTTSLGTLSFIKGEQRRAALCLWTNNDNQQMRPVELIQTNRVS
ncbi:ABC transporter substrate-binding protein [Pseudomonas sp. 210_17 TE3656]